MEQQRFSLKFSKGENCHTADVPAFSHVLRFPFGVVFISGTSIRDRIKLALPVPLRPLSLSFTFSLFTFFASRSSSLASYCPFRLCIYFLLLLTIFVVAGSFFKINIIIIRVYRDAHAGVVVGLAVCISISVLGTAASLSGGIFYSHIYARPYTGRLENRRQTNGFAAFPYSLLSFFFLFLAKPRAAFSFLHHFLGSLSRRPCAQSVYAFLFVCFLFLR